MTQSGHVPELAHRSEWKGLSSLTAACLAMEALGVQEEQTCWGPSNPARGGSMTPALVHPPQHCCSQPSPPLCEGKRTLYLSALTAHNSLLLHGIYSSSIPTLYFVRRVSDTSYSDTSVLGCVFQMLPKYCPLFCWVAHCGVSCSCSALPVQGSACLLCLYKTFDNAIDVALSNGACVKALVYLLIPFLATVCIV